MDRAMSQPLMMQQVTQQVVTAPDPTQSCELRLVGVQVGCVLGKAGENITQIRKVCLILSSWSLWCGVLLQL